MVRPKGECQGKREGVGAKEDAASQIQLNRTGFRRQNEAGSNPAKPGHDENRAIPNFFTALGGLHGVPVPPV
jgi:hypothetical protein